MAHAAPSCDLYKRIFHCAVLHHRMATSNGEIFWQAPLHSCQLRGGMGMCGRHLTLCKIKAAGPALHSHRFSPCQKVMKNSTLLTHTHTHTHTHTTQTSRCCFLRDCESYHFCCVASPGPASPGTVAARPAWFAARSPWQAVRAGETTPAAAWLPAWSRWLP